MRTIKLFLILFFLSLSAYADVATTGTVTDPDGTVWANGQITFTLHNNAGGVPKLNGVPMTADQMTVVGLLNGGGTFSVGLSDNTQITPVGTQWAYQICPAATSPCQTFPLVTASGATLSLTTAISATIQSIRIPASYNTRAYTDIEISPLPPAGATYYNLTSTLIRYWNGTIWQPLGTGGGGGGSPNAPAKSVQVANAAVNGFDSNANLLYDTTTSTLTAKANVALNALSSTPRNSYDPVDTKFQGGLMAAIAGTSGFTPTQVLQYTENYGWCQGHLGLAPAGGIDLPLPSGITINIGTLILTNGSSFGGQNLGSMPTLQHISNADAMIRGTKIDNSDTITCPQDGQTYHPGASGDIFIHDFFIAGMGNNPGGVWDMGIYLNGPGDMAYNIRGGGQTFGGPAIFIGGEGLQKYVFRAGSLSSQLQGCAAYTTGNLSITTQSPLGTQQCQTVQDNSTDSEIDYVYGTDGAAFLAGKGPGACYPNCGVVSMGNNTRASHIFGQLSDITVRPGNNDRINDIRSDGSSMEAVRIVGGGNNIENIMVSGDCNSLSLQPNYNAGVNTGCKTVNDLGQGNKISHINYGASLFGSVFQECIIASNTIGGTAVGGEYGMVEYRGFPDNNTRNDMAYCGASQGDQASARVNIPDMAPMDAHNALVNVSGISAVNLASGQNVTHITGGYAGQSVYFVGVPGATITPGQVGLETIGTCTGRPEINDGFKTFHFRNKAGFASAFGPNNAWVEICNTPVVTPLQVNFAGNPAPTLPSIASVYGNIQPFQIPNPTTLDASQLHGPAAPSGQYCFREKLNFTDGFYIMSNETCTPVDLAHQTPGEIFGITTPQNTSVELYMSSNTTTSGIPTGRIGACTLSFCFWDGPTTIAAGGDGSVSPAANANYTGMVLNPWGALINTYNNTQPPCDQSSRGRLWLVSGGGSNPDVYQGCIQTGGSTYAWANVGIAISGTTGIVPIITGPGSTGNSHLDEITNAGADTFSQPVIIQDGSGNGAYDVGAEGTMPTGCAALGSDCLWADATNHNWTMYNNNQGPFNVMGIGTPGASGNCPKFSSTDGTVLVDSGAPCGGGSAAPGTPTLLMDSGAGTAPTAVSLSAGSTDYSGYVNFTSGTCTGGVCPAPSVGIFTLTYSRTYTPQLKCFVQPSNLAAMALANTVRPFIPFGQLTTAHFVAVSNATGIAQSTAYAFYYHCDPQ